MFKKFILFCIGAVFCSCTNNYENDFNGYWRQSIDIQSDYEYILSILDNLSLELEESEFWTESSGDNHTFIFDYYTDDSGHSLDGEVILKIENEEIIQIEFRSFHFDDHFIDGVGKDLIIGDQGDFIFE
jgi:hypothetical protein